MWITTTGRFLHNEAADTGAHEDSNVLGLPGLFVEVSKDYGLVHVKTVRLASVRFVKQLRMT